MHLHTTSDKRPTHYPATKDAEPSCLDHFLVSDQLHSMTPLTVNLPSATGSDHVRVMMAFSDLSSILVPPAAPQTAVAKIRIKVPAKTEQPMELKNQVTTTSAMPAQALKHTLWQALAHTDACSGHGLAELERQVHGLVSTDISQLTLAVLDHATPGQKLRNSYRPRKQAREVRRRILGAIAKPPGHRKNRRKRQRKDKANTPQPSVCNSHGGLARRTAAANARSSGTGQAPCQTNAQSATANHIT